MKIGLLINSIVALGISVISILTSFFIYRRRKRGLEVITGAYSLFWLSLSFLYLFVSLRTFSAFISRPDLDKLFFLIDNGFGGLMAPFMVFLFLFFLTEKIKVSLSGSLISLIIWAIWLYVNVSGGLKGPSISYWTSEWKPMSDTAILINFIGLYLPAIVSVIGIGVLSLRFKEPLARFRALMTSISAFVIGTAVLMDYIGTIGIPGRFLILVASASGLIGFNPPDFILKKLTLHESTP